MSRIGTHDVSRSVNKTSRHVRHVGSSATEEKMLNKPLDGALVFAALK